MLVEKIQGVCLELVVDPVAKPGRTEEIPMTGAAACCARATSGPAATPPSSDMKSRRLIR
jgi:hypothetical protein